MPPKRGAKKKKGTKGTKWSDNDTDNDNDDIPLPSSSSTTVPTTVTGRSSDDEEAPVTVAKKSRNKQRLNDRKLSTTTTSSKTTTTTPSTVEGKAAVGEVKLEPENIALNIYYEDDEIIVLMKPAGMVVHPAPDSNSHYHGTLVNALLHHCGAAHLASTHDQTKVRPGIVHRLDRDTSGLMV
jgi:23S rRNA-/tRNA-specific pseudouridylate synthase